MQLAFNRNVLKRIRRSRRSRSRGGSNWLGGLALGATAMYLLDADQGARRRSILRDKLSHSYYASIDLLSKARRDLEHRAEGMRAELRQLVLSEQVPDNVLTERVRSQLGRVVSHPHAIGVHAQDGNVTLSGPILRDELEALLHRARSVRGVRNVVSALEPHEASDKVPSLQGEGRPPRPRSEIAQENWTPSLRVLAALSGAGLGVAGARRGGFAGVLMAGAGAGLFARAATNLPARRLFGPGAGRRAIDLRKTAIVHAPIDEVFAVFSNLEQFPRFMEHVRVVTITGEGRSRWTVAGPPGTAISFDVEITKLVPNRVLAWRTVKDSTIEHAGVIHFEEQPDGSTRVDVQMSYNPVAGAMGHLVAKLFRVDPKHALDDDLLRFKSLLEEGKTRAHHREVESGEVLEPVARSSAELHPAGSRRP